MTNPNNAVGTNGAFGGRTSVDAFNDGLASYSAGIMSGWACEPSSGLTVVLGGDGNTRDVAIAEDNAGNKTTINNISGSPISVTVGAAPNSNSRIDSIVAYVDNPPTGSSTATDNYGACGLIAVPGTVASSPVAPNESTIRTAITADGASGTTAYYVVLANITIASGTTDIDSTMILAGNNAGIGGQNIDYSRVRDVLFTGSKQAPVTLSVTAGDYDMLRIFYRDNNQVYGSVDVYSPNGKNVFIESGYNDTAGFFLKTQTVTISGTTIDQATGTYAYELAFGANSVSRTTVNNIWFTRIEGWKFD